VFGFVTTNRRSARELLRPGSVSYFGAPRTPYSCSGSGQTAEPLAEPPWDAQTPDARGVRLVKVS